MNKRTGTGSKRDFRQEYEKNEQFVFADENHRIINWSWCEDMLDEIDRLWKMLNTEKKLVDTQRRRLSKLWEEIDRLRAKEKLNENLSHEKEETFDEFMHGLHCSQTSFDELARNHYELYYKKRITEEEEEKWFG